jgi:hypothetical protein
MDIALQGYFRIAKGRNECGEYHKLQIMYIDTEILPVSQVSRTAWLRVRFKTLVEELSLTPTLQVFLTHFGWTKKNGRITLMA